MSGKSGKTQQLISTKEPKSSSGEAAAPDTAEQTRLFEQAVSLFTRGDYAGALPLFERAAEGPARDLAAAARSRARICEWKASPSQDNPQSAEEHYHYGLAHFNQRRFPEAERHFLQALRLAPNADHILYALALSQGWKGDIDACAATLRRAIELNPSNLTQARKDPDLQDLLRFPAIAAILYPQRGGAN